jgi:hypothetical protein
MREKWKTTTYMTFVNRHIENELVVLRVMCDKWQVKRHILCNTNLTCTLADQSRNAGITYEHFVSARLTKSAEKFQESSLLYVPWMLGCEIGYVRNKLYYTLIHPATHD